MSPRTYEHIDCSVARSIELIGERWTMLILRDAFYGIRRFDEFQNSLGIARNILTSRLNGLVESGIMRKVRYQDHPVRYEYRVTEKGRDLVPVITTLLAWGDKWESDEVPVALIHDDCGHATHAKVVCDHCSQELTAFNLRFDPIPKIVQERVIETRLAKL
jgi:DNA-binding HxlR family transcriptional regulator